MDKQEIISEFSERIPCWDNQVWSIEENIDNNISRLLNVLGLSELKNGFEFKRHGLEVYIDNSESKDLEELEDILSEASFILSSDSSNTFRVWVCDRFKHLRHTTSDNCQEMYNKFIK